VTRARAQVAAIAAVLAGVALSACSSSAAPTPGFTPQGKPGSTANTSTGTGTVTPGHYVMPPFGHNAHVNMTNWLPSNSSWAAAVETDKDFQLYYLYSEYTSGRDATWEQYVGPNLLPGLRSSLSASDVTTQSFIGTIRYFDMQAYPDPSISKYLDVQMCFDNADSSNTDASTGKTLPDTTPANDHYYMMIDQLEKNSAGKWHVAAEEPAVYYPEAKECKP
jgi:hypothetical protein